MGLGEPSPHSDWYICARGASMSEHGPATVGVVCVLQYFEPADPENELDVSASGFVEYMYNEWWLNSLLRGDYDLNFDRIIQPEERRHRLVRGCDFLGVNYYSKWRVRHADKGWGSDFDFELAPCAEGCTDSGFEIYPEGLRYVLDWAYKRYKRVNYVTENGIADSKNLKREGYLLSHLEQVHDAIELDSVPVRGYFHWTLIENLEWADGYKMQFGLFNVDRVTKERTPTKAVSIYREISAKNALPE